MAGNNIKDSSSNTSTTTTASTTTTPVKGPITPSGAPPRRAMNGGDEPTTHHSRFRTPLSTTNHGSRLAAADNLFSPTTTAATTTTTHHQPPAAPPPTVGISRRRSSNFSEYSLNEARRAFRSSSDSLLLPRPTGAAAHMAATNPHTSHWDSAPLAFALLPALGGLIFTNGSHVVTDIMLLGLAAIFLNWSVRLPWDWYHSAQETRVLEEARVESVQEESEDENALSFSTTTLEEVPEDEATESSPPKSTPSPKPAKRNMKREAATNELYLHEILALLSCFLFPMLGAYLLHTIRSQLSRPSEGLVSDYNLTIFLLASEMRPMAHLVKLIQARTLHLQRIVTGVASDQPAGGMQALVQRLEDLETQADGLANLPASEPAMSSKQSATLTAEIRRSLQPEIDALNRAVRRYEKRATLQTLQTESRLQDLESRLNDAISLAAAAANLSQHRRISAVLGEWITAAISLPLHALGALVSLPFKLLSGLMQWGRSKMLGGSKTADKKRKKASGLAGPAHNSVRLGGSGPSHSRLDRLQGKITGKR